MATTFMIMTYPDRKDSMAAYEWARDKGYEYVYILHDKDCLEDGSKEEPHYQGMVRVPNEMSVSAFSKNTGLDKRWIRERNNYKETALYLLHRSKESMEDERKFKYPLEELKGDDRLIVKIKKLLEYTQGNRQKPAGEDDKGILQILDFIESFDYLSTAVLVRWCCENGLYSVYRRAGRIVADCLAEHNRNCQFTLQDTLYQKRLEMLEKRLSEQEKELERAYGDLWERQKNPFTGNIALAEKTVDMDLIRKIQEGA